MDVISTLWQLGILAAVLIFGIKLGLATGLANFSKKYLLGVSIGYGGGVLILCWIASFFTQEITNWIYAYNFEFFLIMAAIMIVAGIFTIREYKVYEKNTAAATAMAVIAPCPCCFGSILVSVLLVAPTIGLGAINLSVYVALALVATIVITYFLSKSFVKVFLDKPYPIILGNFMFFLGLYYLISALFLPYITDILINTMNPITIASTDNLAIFVILLVIVILVGMVISRKRSHLS